MTKRQAQDTLHRMLGRDSDLRATCESVPGRGGRIAIEDTRHAEREDGSIRRSHMRYVTPTGTWHEVMAEAARHILRSLERERTVAGRSLGWLASPEDLRLEAARRQLAQQRLDRATAAAASI